MAIGTPRFPLEEISGVLGKKDRSVGKEPGFGLNISDSSGKSILGLKTAATKTRSPGQIERSAAYCFCDEEWKKLSPEKTAYCQTFHTKVRRLSYYHMTNYLCWMSLCMSSAWDETAFRLNSYITRYAVKNTTGETWTDKKVLLTGINTKLETGTDLTVLQTGFYRQPMQTLSHKVGTPGTAIVCLPEIAPSDTIYIDVYSYGTYSTPQNCPVTSRAEIDEDILKNTSFRMSALWAYDINITWTAPVSGYVYWFFFEMWDHGNIDVSEISTNFPMIEFVGLTEKKCYYAPVNVYCMGLVNAGQTYNATGRVKGAGEDICGSPAAAVPNRFNYPPTPPLTASKQHMSPGAFDTCGGDFLSLECYIVEADTYTQITPESIIKIGPT